MTPLPNPRGMTRREILKRGTALSAAFIAGAGFLAHATDAWAVELKALSPETMASLIQMARDIYPHDRIADRIYAIAVKGHDDKAAEDAGHKALIEDGIADLDDSGLVEINDIEDRGLPVLRKERTGSDSLVPARVVTLLEQEAGQFGHRLRRVIEAS